MRKSSIVIQQKHDLVRTPGLGPPNGEFLCDSLPNQKASIPLHWNLYLWARAEFSDYLSITVMPGVQIKVRGMLSK